MKNIVLGLSVLALVYDSVAGDGKVADDSPQRSGRLFLLNRLFGGATKTLVGLAGVIPALNKPEAVACPVCTTVAPETCPAPTAEPPPGNRCNTVGDISGNECPLGQYCAEEEPEIMALPQRCTDRKLPGFPCDFDYECFTTCDISAVCTGL